MMKKTIVLIRHGKAVPIDTFKKDIDRVLAERGVNDGYKVGYKLVEDRIIPDLILTSPAARASHTAHILTRAMRVSSEMIKIIDTLYHCTTDSVMSEIKAVPDDIRTLFLVGHNPGITDMAYLLSGGATTFLPTTGVAILTFEADNWIEILQLQCVDFKMIKPKELS